MSRLSLLALIITLPIASLAVAGTKDASTKRAPKTKDSTVYEGGGGIVEEVCVFERGVRDSCTSRDIRKAKDTGVLVTRGYADTLYWCDTSGCGVFEESDLPSDGVFVLADDTLFFYDDESAEDERPYEEEESRGGPLADCVLTCVARRADCLGTIHLGLDPDEQRDICNEDFGDCLADC